MPKRVPNKAKEQMTVYFAQFSYFFDVHESPDSVGDLKQGTYSGHLEMVLTGPDKSKDLLSALRSTLKALVDGEPAFRRPMRIELRYVAAVREPLMMPVVINHHHQLNSPRVVPLRERGACEEESLLTGSTPGLAIYHQADPPPSSPELVWFAEVKKGHISFDTGFTDEMFELLGEV